ncbi:prepilin-type cleavage/methylation domain-containing protein [Alteromonas sp. CYL-A6]|uniref:prepilin-type cleavage/methylation domain-containing protein n=1 Tax=Alteromonas nitratireducens TaxID=3390813 RepID=UPI0034B01BBB
MRGFTLVEVLVAAFIIMLSVTGFVALQSEYMKSDAKLNLRTVALQLADEKVDDLRQFTTLTAEAGEFAYNDIADDAGGEIAAGVVTVELKQGDAVSYDFTRNWTVTNQYLVDTDADGTGDTWLNEGDAGLPVPAPTVPGRKLVEITVSWQDQNGDNTSVTVNSSLAPVLISRSFVANNETANAKTQPQVKYTPGVAPDVIAYDLGNGETIETSKPVPDIDNKGNNNIVEFETVRYVDLPEEADKLEQEDFLTVNCSCALAGSGTGYTPARTVYNGKELVVEKGEAITKTIGEAVGTGQPEICNQCCRDHHDTTAMVSEEKYYRKEYGVAHRHYQRQPDGTFVPASSTGDLYDEVCRFKRVDGYYELYPDWQMIDIIEFRDNYLLDADRLASYTTYTEDVVEAQVAGRTAPTKPADRNITVPPGGYQLISRGIYLDYMTDEHRAAVRAMIADGREDWKAFVPFYDINLTLLSGWRSSNTDAATVTSEAIKTILDPDNDFYGTYSRGRVEALFDGEANITTYATRYNSGITGSGPISPADFYYALFDNTLKVTVDSKSSAEKFYALVANINCLITIGGVTEPCETNNDKKSSFVDLTALTITKDPNQFLCTVTVPKGKSTPFFSCNNVSENWRGTLRFGLPVTGALVNFKVRMPDGSIVDTNEISLSSGLDATSTEEYELIIEVTK